MSGPYSISMVPPNLTGDLHLGHALMATVQDCLARHQAIQGRQSVYVPGVDHAGIGMYALVLGAHDFLGDQPMGERLRAWAAEHRERITGQLRALRLDCAWERFSYTLEPRYVRLVHHGFRELARAGLVYRARRVLPWCPSCLTTISDMECELRLEEREVALVPVRFDGRSQPVELPFPELAWAVGALIVPGAGWPQTVPHPAGGAPIPVLRGPDGPRFLTPGHSPQDHRFALAHGLAATVCLDPSARALIEEAAGMQRDAFRAWTVRRLGLSPLRRQVPVAHCGRCGAELAPRPTWQWFLRMRPLADSLLQAIGRGEVAILPQGVARDALDWLARTEDWCLSRQIPWGQRIPARRCPSCSWWTLGRERDCRECGEHLVVERDVLDTWFSAAFWPLGAAGWPDAEEVERLYPNSVLTTGRDILFFWALRVLTLCRFLTGRWPAPVCYLHGLVRDAAGAKMSKSRGNTITVDAAIARHGADVLRAGLLSACRGADDLRALPTAFQRQELVRTTLGQLMAEGPRTDQRLDGLDHWCLARVAAVRADVDRALLGFDFAGALRALTWLALVPLAVYVRIRRRETGSGNMAPAHLLSALADLFEPVMPDAGAELRRAAGHPETVELDTDRAAAAGALLAVAAELRRLRGSLGWRGAPPGLRLSGAATACLKEAWAVHALAARPEESDGLAWVPEDQPEAVLTFRFAESEALRREARRRLRRLGKRRRSLRRRLEAAQAGAGEPAHSACRRLGVTLAELDARTRLLRANAAAARVSRLPTGAVR